MKQDTITSSQRIEALLNGKLPDRVPLFHFALGFCAKNVGYTVSTIYREPEKSFTAQALTKQQYGHDGDPFFDYASCGGWEFSGETKLPEGEYEQALSHGRPAVTSEKDVERLELPDIKIAGMLPHAMRFSHLQ